MYNFYLYSSISTKIIYLLSFFSMIIYFVFKYRKRKYIVSIFNYNLFFCFFSIYVSLFFQYTNKSWFKLGEVNFKKFTVMLNSASKINLLGFLFFFIFLSIFEFKDRSNFLKKYQKIKIFKDINYEIIKIMNCIYIILTLCLYIFIFKTIPLFGNRIIALQLGNQTLYNILIGSLTVFTVTLILNRKKSKLIYLNMILIICSGNRGPVIMLLAYLLIIKIYTMAGNIKSKQKKIMLVFVLLFVLGMLLEFLRGSGTGNILEKILYGNTFSDVRDGAYILYNIQKKSFGFLYGKTYLADLIGFIPAKYSNFRSVWGYSLFTTSTLLKWKNHFGLRGGIFLTSYFNFGYLGILISSFLFAYLMSILEKIFFCIYIKKRKFRNYGLGMYLYVILLFGNSLMTPSGFIQFYVAFINLIILMFLSKIFKYNKT